MTQGVTDDSNYTNIANAIRAMSAGDTDELTLTPAEMALAIRALKAIWGNISGSITDQTDLKNALDEKANTSDLGSLADHDSVNFETEITNKPSAYPPTAHNHDDLYYTETEVDTLLNAKQNSLTFDTTPTANSTNPVQSDGIKTALDAKADASAVYTKQESDTLINTKANSADVTTALALKANKDETYTKTETDTLLNNKQNTLTFDDTPTANSNNPVTSGGIKTALDTVISYADNLLGMKRYGVTGVGGSAAVLTRTFDAVGMTAQVGTDGDNSSVVNDFDNAVPFNRRKCVGEWTLEDDKAVFHVRAYYGDDNYTEDGSMGDYVAVECPRAYYYRNGQNLIISAHQYPGYRPFDIFCRNHNPADTMPYVYLPAYALSLDANNHAICLPGYDNEQGCYYDLVTRARTYKDGALGGLSMVEPAGVNFYEYAMVTVEFATQNTETILKGCIGLRHDNADLCTFRSATQVLLANYNGSRVVGEYVAIIANNTDRNDVRYKATHRITAMVRCDSSGNASSSGTYTLITLEDLGKNYYTYDLTGATTYRFVARPWRTGSCNNVSTPSGSPVSNTNGCYPMKYRWRENVWGNQWNTSMDLFDQRIGTGDDDYYLKWYYLNIPEDYVPSASGKPDATELASDIFTCLDVQTDHANYKDGYIKSKKFSELYPDIWIPYETTGASATTYYADYAYLVYSYVVRAVRFGGAWYHGSIAGPSSVSANYAPSLGHAHFGAHLFIKQG